MIPDAWPAGRFTLSADLVHCMDPVVLSIMGECAVMAVRPLAEQYAFEYTALCARFGSIARDARIPIYQWSRGSDGALQARRVA